MPHPTHRLREDALQIWRAGLDAVRSESLVGEYLRVDANHLVIDGDSIDLESLRRIVVVGAGKAGAGMAAGVEEALGERIAREKQLDGWVNVPADCVRDLRWIHLHAARPAGLNEPTPEGVVGSNKILELVGSLESDDLCLCLISGGGSALLPAPAEGVSLADKQEVTRLLSAAGANIVQLNTVRKQLSRIKGGGLARACRAGRLVTLIISDVLGDPLDVIASGPTVADPSTPSEALAVLQQFAAASAPPAVLDFLRRAAASEQPLPTCDVQNLVIGNNATAVDAAGAEAERLGYRHAMHAATQLEGEAELIGRHLADMARHMRRSEGPNCLITGGEPVVRLVEADRRGKGGRSQQLVLAALVRLVESEDAESIGQNHGVAILSGGTDGEDGPTDAAGAVLDDEVIRQAAAQKLDPRDYLARNDAYTFFDATGGLIKTGPTNTNVCDVRVVLVDRE